MNKAHCYTIEARWDKGTHEAPGEQSFFVVDEVGGVFDDAKRTAKSYLHTHVASSDSSIEWVEGICRGKKCYYGRTEFVTFRVTW